ncbi:MAG: hypothetical protein ISS38_01795 [Candidatus Cloacimonetes bacterium]|nr:hypothetical protein [Candidatus Cloacimonadota bacterium]
MRKSFLIILLFILLIQITLAGNSYEIHKKSKFKAALFSAILPGSGEYYSNNKKSAIISFATETVIWLGYFGFLEQAKWAENDYKKYVYAYSGSNIRNGDGEYYSDLQNYFCSDDFNNNVRIYGRYGLEYLNWSSSEHNDFIQENFYQSDAEWDWQSKEVWYRYGELRRKKNEYIIMAKFTIGAMIINRVVSMIKAVRSTSNYNSSLSLNYNFDPINQKISLSLEKKF